MDIFSSDSYFSPIKVTQPRSTDVDSGPSEVLSEGSALGGVGVFWLFVGVGVDEAGVISMVGL